MAPREGTRGGGGGCPRCRAIVLVGMRGAGKTTVGRALAARLAWPFVDGDDLVSTAAGQPAGEWLRLVGEVRFREVERECLLRQIEVPGPWVLATGGGAVTIAEVRAALRARDLLTVWLQAPPDCLEGRLTASPIGRPPLTGRPLGEEVRLLVTQRAACYGEVARVTVDTGSTTVAEAVEAILAAYHGAGPAARDLPGPVAGP